MIKRINYYTIDGDEIVMIDCPKCKGKNGIRRKNSLVVKCFTCCKKIGKLEV